MQKKASKSKPKKTKAKIASSAIATPVYTPTPRARPLITCYTDGSYLPTYDVGGYCAYLECQGKSLIISGSEHHTTVNRMEIKALYEALNIITIPSIYYVYTDSKYVSESIAKKWIDKWYNNHWISSKNQPVPNADLWSDLYVLLKRHIVHISWVKGHAGIPGNMLCDEVAGMQSASLNDIIRHEFWHQPDPLQPQW